MTPEMTQTWRDELARCKSERDRFRALATACKSEARDLRKHKHFVEALESDQQAALHRATAVAYGNKMVHAKSMLKG